MELVFPSEKAENDPRAFAPAPASDEFKGFGHSDPVNPGRKPGLSPETPNGLEHLGKDLLGDIFSILPVLKQGKGRIIGFVGILLKQFPVSLLITGFKSFYEVLFRQIVFI